MSDRRVGECFKEYRVNAALTQSELAEKIGMTENYISAIECGRSFPRYKPMLAILNILKIPPNVLFAEVLDYDVDQPSTPLTDRLSRLPVKEQRRIMEIIDFLVEQAEQENEEC